MCECSGNCKCKSTPEKNQRMSNDEIFQHILHEKNNDVWKYRIKGHNDKVFEVWNYACRNFEFECKRTGDYLTLKVARPDYLKFKESESDVKSNNPYYRNEKSEQFAVNLFRAKTVRLELGRVPDLNGCLNIFRTNSYEQFEKNSGVMPYTYDFPYINGIFAKYEEVLAPQNSRITNCTSTGIHGGGAVSVGYGGYFGHGSAGEGCTVVSSSDLSVPHPQALYVFESVARPAIDDSIVFADVGTLYVPAGKGEAVFASIAKAIGLKEDDKHSKK